MRPRTRYTIIGNWKFNDHDLRGQVVVDLGPCRWDGSTASGSKKLPKREQTHRLLRFEDKKWLKATGLPTATVTVESNRMSWAVREATEAEVAAVQT